MKVNSKYEIYRQYNIAQARFAYIICKYTLQK